MQPSGTITNGANGFCLTLAPSACGHLGACRPGLNMTYGNGTVLGIGAILNIVAEPCNGSPEQVSRPGPSLYSKLSDDNRPHKGGHQCLVIPGPRLSNMVDFHGMALEILLIQHGVGQAWPRAGMTLSMPDLGQHWAAERRSSGSMTPVIGVLLVLSAPAHGCGMLVSAVCFWKPVPAWCCSGACIGRPAQVSACVETASFRDPQ